MKGNIRGKETSVFVGVGVAQHDFNGLGSAWGQRGLVQDALKEIWRPGANPLRFRREEPLGGFGHN